MIDYKIRPATPEDAPIVTAHRRAMFEDMHEGDKDQLDWMVGEYEVHVRTKLGDGAYHGWLVEDEAGNVVAGAGMEMVPWPANPWSRMKGRPVVMNVYVQPEHRKQGLARRLMETIIEWARENGIAHLELNASAEGRHLYESLGFEPNSGEMSLHL